MKKIQLAASLAHAPFDYLADFVSQADQAGMDLLHIDATDMNELHTSQLVGGPREIASLRSHTVRPIECHLFSPTVDLMFIHQLMKAGTSMLILPAEHFIGPKLGSVIHWCRERNLKIGLTIGFYTPLSFIEESIYDIDRVHILAYGVDETDGQDNWAWRKSVLDLIKRTKQLIQEKNPSCELAIEGGLRPYNLAPIVELQPDILVFSSAIFKHPEGISQGIQACQEAITIAQQNIHQ